MSEFKIGKIVPFKLHDEENNITLEVMVDNDYVTIKVNGNCYMLSTKNLSEENE